MQRTRTAFAVAVVVVLCGLAAIVAVIVHAATGSGNGTLPASSVPGVTQTPPGGPCLDSTQARSVWNDVNARLDALSLHPDTQRVGDVAQGTAASEIRQYLQKNLIDKNLTERERERLDDITVVQPGCAGQPLTVHISETVVQDDYLRPDGHLDHTDSAVGTTLHMLESYVRSGGTWKIIALTPLDQPTPQGNII
jgi:hypothetical protein